MARSRGKTTRQAAAISSGVQGLISGFQSNIGQSIAQRKERDRQNKAQLEQIKINNDLRLRAEDRQNEAQDLRNIESTINIAQSLGGNPEEIRDILVSLDSELGLKFANVVKNLPPEFVESFSDGFASLADLKSLKNEDGILDPRKFQQPFNKFVDIWVGIGQRQNIADRSFLRQKLTSIGREKETRTRERGVLSRDIAAKGQKQRTQAAIDTQTLAKKTADAQTAAKKMADAQTVVPDDQQQLERAKQSLVSQFRGNTDMLNLINSASPSTIQDIVDTQLKSQVLTKAPPATRPVALGTEREVISRELFGKGAGELLPNQLATVSREFIARDIDRKTREEIALNAAKLRRPLTPKDRRNIINPVTFQPFRSSEVVSFQDAIDKEGVFVSDAQKRQLGDFDGARIVIASLSSQLDGLIQATEGFDALKQGGVLTLKAISRQNPQAAVFRDTVNAFTGKLIKALGGESGGRLSDQDFKRFQGALPKLSDTVDIANVKIGILETMSELAIEIQKNNILGISTPQADIDAAFDLVLEPIKQARQEDVPVDDTPTEELEKSSISDLLNQLRESLR